jgi:hypothetical protein
MVPFSWIKIRRITLQVKKQQYFALVMTAGTEVKFEEKHVQAREIFTSDTKPRFANRMESNTVRATQRSSGIC